MKRVKREGILCRWCEHPVKDQAADEKLCETCLAWAANISPVVDDAIAERDRARRGGR